MDKEEYLREQGWTDLWHPNNWVKESWVSDPNINVDWAGIPMESAYKRAKREEKTKELKPNQFILDGEVVTIEE